MIKPCGEVDVLTNRKTKAVGRRGELKSGWGPLDLLVALEARDQISKYISTSHCCLLSPEKSCVVGQNNLFDQLQRVLLVGVDQGDLLDLQISDLASSVQVVM